MTGTKVGCGPDIWNEKRFMKENTRNANADASRAVSGGIIKDTTEARKWTAWLWSHLIQRPTIEVLS